MTAKDMANRTKAVKDAEEAARRQKWDEQDRRVRERIRAERKKVPAYVAAIKMKIAAQADKGECVLYQAWKWGNCHSDVVERATAEAIARILRKEGYTVDVRHWAIYPRLNAEGYSLGGGTTFWGEITVTW
jgi:YD repeat-containing protein